MPALSDEPRLTLLQRDDCPLCDAALEVLALAHAPEFASIWIDGDASLEAHYGDRVPVLRDEVHGTELNWPFDADAVRAFLS
jgi:glutaredoxin